MYNRFYLREVQLILQYRDRRSVKRWCQFNNVGIFVDKGTKRYYVLKSEFEAAINKNNLQLTTKKFETRESNESGFMSILLNS